MPTDKPKVLLTLDTRLLERLEDFRFENRFSSRSKAIRHILEKALKEYEKSKVKNKPPHE